MDYFWDILHSVGVTSTPPSNAIFPECYRGDINRDYVVVVDGFNKEIIGSGSFGQVRRVKLRGVVGDPEYKDRVFACKTILKSAVPDPEVLKQEVRNLNLCQNLSPHIIKLYDVCEDYHAIHIITELCTGGELYDRVAHRSTRHQWTETMYAQVIHQILSALACMHHKRVAHRDLKASNFLFLKPLLLNTAESSPPDIRIIDFGLSKHVKNCSSDGDDKQHQEEETTTSTFNGSATSTTTTSTATMNPIMTSEVGTPYFVAPEVLCNDRYDFKCDVYSVGVIAYLCLTGKLPIQGNDERETVKLLMDPTTEIDFTDGTWGSAGQEQEKAVSSCAKDFCQALLQRNPENRPTATEALTLDWMVQNVGHPPPLPSALVTDREGKQSHTLPCLAKTVRGSKGGDMLYC
jgi:calcium-dependent protein kinase